MRELWLMRHGTAEATSFGGDEGRALTEEGREGVRRAARSLERLGVRPDAVWHSPYLRAVETAQLVKEVLVLRGASPIRSELTPHGAARRAGEMLFEATERRLLVVSHLPVLPEICVELLGAPLRLDVVPASVVHLKVLGGQNAGGSSVLCGFFPGDALAALSPS